VSQPVSRAVIESRLEQYRGNDRQRANTLKQLFSEAGCDEPHLSEPSVKGSKLPNVICVLPGGSGKVIIVGAHFDHVSEGHGVVDNWSGITIHSLTQETWNAHILHTCKDKLCVLRAVTTTIKPIA
jgi:hypothetical protein